MALWMRDQRFAIGPVPSSHEIGGKLGVIWLFADALLVKRVFTAAEGSLPPTLTLHRFARPDGTPGAEPSPRSSQPRLGTVHLGRQAVVLQHLHRISFSPILRFWKHSSFFFVPASHVVLHELVRRLGHAVLRAMVSVSPPWQHKNKLPQRRILRLSVRGRRDRITRCFFFLRKYCHLGSDLRQRKSFLAGSSPSRGVAIPTMTVVRRRQGPMAAKVDPVPLGVQMYNWSHGSVHRQVCR